MPTYDSKRYSFRVEWTKLSSREDGIASATAQAAAYADPNGSFVKYEDFKLAGEHLDDAIRGEQSARTENARLKRRIEELTSPAERTVHAYLVELPDAVMVTTTREAAESYASQFGGKEPQSLITVDDHYRRLGELRRESRSLNDQLLNQETEVRMSKDRHAKLLKALNLLRAWNDHHPSIKDMLTAVIREDEEAEKAVPVVQSRETVLSCACGKRSTGTFQNAQGHSLPICDDCRG